MRMHPILLLALLPAATAHAADGRLPEGLKPMPERDLATLNGYLSAPSERYDAPPKVLEAYLPLYPASRLLSGKTGSCKVAFSIEADGKAADAVPDPDADEKMCDHALYALRHWRFAPATKDGHPVGVRFRMPFNYDIE